MDDNPTIYEPVSLKEFFLTKLDSLTKVVEERFRVTDKALVLEATELARRLDILNGEAQRLRDIQATYLPREVYDVSQKEVSKKISEFEAFIATYQGKGSVTAILTSTSISIGIGLLFLGLNYLLRR